MLIDTEALPDLDDMPACAAFRAEYSEALSQLTSWQMTVARRLKKEILRTNRPVGQIGLVKAGGWEYPPRIADEIPQLGVNHYGFTLSCERDSSTVLSVLLEAMPELETELRAHWKVETEVNVTRCLELLNDGGEAARKILQLRIPKRKLGVLVVAG